MVFSAYGVAALGDSLGVGIVYPCTSLVFIHWYNQFFSKHPQILSISLLFAAKIPNPANSPLNYQSATFPKSRRTEQLNELCNIA